MPDEVPDSLAKTSSGEPSQQTVVTNRSITWNYGNGHRTAFFACVSVVTIISLLSIQIWYSMNKLDAIERSTELSTKTASSPKDALLAVACIGLTENPEITTMQRYLLDSLICRVPDIEPFHSDAKLYFANETSEQCTERCTEVYGPLLTSVSPNENGTHTLHLHTEQFSHFDVAPISCCYRNMSANWNYSDRMDFSKCQTFNESVLLNETVEYVKVSCYNKPEENVTSNIYTNVHAFVGMKRQVDNKMEAYEKDICDVHEEELMYIPKPYMSVMIIGIGSMSRLNFKRNMPKTERYLNDNEWYPLNVYNRVGENALSNLAALLAGTDWDALKSTCWSNMTKNDCPWLWEKFSRKGFITAYAEDAPQLDISPNSVATDYFLTPFMRTAQCVSSTPCNETDVQEDCSGPVHLADHVLNYSLEFADTFVNYLTFSVFWLNTLSRKGLNCAGQWDETLYSYLVALEPIRDNALVIFMSDNGENAGEFRQTKMGFYESNLPFIYFSLPRSLSLYDKPDFLKLLNNRNKLTSPFDVYVSLLEVLGEDGTAPGCPTCMSVFAELPENRACADAGIPQQFCACTEYDDILDLNPFKYLGLFVLEQANKLRSAYENHEKPNERCVQHVLKRIKTLRIAASPFRITCRKEKSVKMNSTSDNFMITVQTTRDAIFEATVERDNKNDLEIKGVISRLDDYENRSKCMDHSEGKKYCICDQKASL